MRRVVRTDSAAGAVGPYSQAIVAGGLVWVSGQIALDPVSGRLVEGGIEEETLRAMRSLSAILQAAGSSLDRAVKVTIYLVDLADFETVNRVYGGFFEREPPSRSCVQVAALPRGARVEIDAVAVALS